MRKYKVGLGVFVLALFASLALVQSGTANPPFCPPRQDPSTARPECRRISIEGDHFRVPLVVGSSGLLVILDGPATTPDVAVSLFLNGQFNGGGWPAAGSAFALAPGTWTIELRRNTTGLPTGPLLDTMEARIRPA